VSSGGFNAVTELEELSNRAAVRWQHDGQTTTVLLVGDHDPAGLGRMDKSAADALAFVERFDLYGHEPTHVLRFVHLALTAEQVVEWNVSPSDAAGTKFELEAVDPVTLRDHLSDVLESLTDLDVLADTDAESDAIRREFRTIHAL